MKDAFTKGRYPQNKLTIVGSGIIGALEAYFAFLEARAGVADGPAIRVTVYDKNESISDSTSSNIIPSLTPDEILSVVPRGPALLKTLGILFSQPGGIRVDDVKGVNDSEVAERFKQQAQAYSEDEAGHVARTKALLALGKKSMDLWQCIYDEGDDELRQILEESNFNPCRNEKKSDNSVLHDGYRIDLLYRIEGDARARAEGWKKDYESLGYDRCKILSPDEVKAADPFLATFCDSQSELNEAGERVWKKNAVALFRPGGCLDTGILLPKFYKYLEKLMGTYQSADGTQKNCFQLTFNKQVTELLYDKRHPSLVEGLKFSDNVIKKNKHDYTRSDYVLCPGEAVGTLDSLGLCEPAYAGFAGPTLMLNIPISEEKQEEYKNFNHCMEVHQEGVCLAWQARFRNNQIFIGVGGTKAFYADKKPMLDEDFATNRHLLQLNMINEVLPQFMSLALGRDTKGAVLTLDDLHALEKNNIAKRWVGMRAVACDNVPTLQDTYRKKDKSIVHNLRTTTHLGSGGVSFAPGVVEVSRSKRPKDALSAEILKYSSSLRFYAKSSVPVAASLEQKSVGMNRTC